MKPLVVAVTAAVAAVVTACGTQNANEISFGPLQLTDAGVAAESAVAPTVGGVGVGGAGVRGEGGGASGFVLRTTLPTSTPAPAPVWRLPHATVGDAVQVAGALGIAGTPTRVAGGGWVLRHAGQRLALRSEGSWTYGLDCTPGVPVTQESLDVMCASASSGGVAVAPGLPGAQASVPPPPPSGPTDAQVRALAAPMLSRLGWGGATLDVSVGGPTTSVTASRTLPGTATTGWTTTLEFAAGGKLVDGSGIVGQPGLAHRYPLISATRAYQLLLAQPRPMTEMCAVRKDRRPGCEPVPPTVITGASLGLSLRHEFDQPLLVPSWLFDVKGSNEPTAVVALDPHWLKPPATVVPRPMPPQSGQPQSVNPAGPAVKPS